MSNARHQQALAARNDQVLELRTEIHTALAAIAQRHTPHEPSLLELLGELADTRQSIGIGVVSEAAAQARATGDALDRAAARGQLGHIATTGLGWLNTADVGVGTGQIPAPVTMQAVSAFAEIRFTLQHHIQRLGRPAAKAARLAAAADEARKYCTWPRPTIATYLHTASVDVDCPLTDLVTHLDALCTAYTDRPGLAAIARDLNRLEALARDVVHGPARTPHPDPCPWCGTKSLVVHHRAEGTTATVIRCEGDHPCRCDFDFCTCHRNPRSNRHEWINSGGATNTWHTLRNLQNIRKELTRMETKALDTLGLIHAIHRTTWTYDDGTEQDAFVMAPAGTEIPTDHECGTHCAPADPDPDGVEIWHALPVCTSCSAWTPTGELTHALYPCPTIQAIQAADLDLPASR